ncbi:DKNYY domain-containing protein [Galbibacter sp. EGI 63066]|uniref:DKNYY domain-containing protein n=1 Tax=Galbibacter sp. EGI 63066 TaxID=2993559 RepID=UPI002248F209|nr:DKNYY domain-containing protein [Galbibacter sp. EGI 63066]MCX2680459.1 DKNYY domain-containing protein [Galbibacter sp. EGI 63066]
MKFLTDHPYLLLILIIIVVNYIIKKIIRDKHSPLVSVFLFFIAVMTQACDQFSNRVDKSVSVCYYYSKSGNDICFRRQGNWFEDLPIPKIKLNADVESFKVIDLHFGKDKNYWYFKENKIIDKEVDFPSFTVAVGERFCYDKNNVYVPLDYLDYKSHLTRLREKRLVNIKANPKTFKKIDRYWAKDDKHYFYDFYRVQADYDSFEILNKTYAKDKEYVFIFSGFHYFGKIIENADPNTFEIFEDSGYSKDKSHVFYWGKILKEADPATFGPSEGKNTSLFYQDKNHKYIEAEIIDEE